MITGDPPRPPPGVGKQDQALRPEIAASWWRSQLQGVAPGLPADKVPKAELLGADERLRLAVGPILDRLAVDLGGTNAAIVLADHRSVVLDRRGPTKAIVNLMDDYAITTGFAFSEGDVGTNGIGTAAEERRLVRIAGVEHYLEMFKQFTCYGVPLVNPIRHRLVGVLDLTFPVTDEHPLMASWMRNAGQQIQTLLAEWASQRERAQFDCFLTLSRGRRAILSTIDDAVLLSHRARELNPVDQAALLGVAAEMGTSDHGAVVQVPIGGDGEPVEIRVHAQSDEAKFPGVVLEVLRTPSRQSRSRRVPASLPGLVGDSPAWRTFCDEIDRAVGADTPLLLVGEPGVGKMAVAEAVHRRSGRPHLTVLDVALVLVDGPASWLRCLRQALGDAQCSVVVRHLELCEPALAAAMAAEIDRCPSLGGRLFGTLTVPAEVGAQPLLGRFCLRLHVPAMRDRRDDVETLVRCFVSRHGRSSVRFHPEAIAVLRSADFHGNARELEAVVAGIVATKSGDVLAADLPALGPTGPVHLSPLERAERQAIVEAMRKAKGNKAAAAEVLGISRPTLYKKLAAYKIERYPSSRASGNSKNPCP